VQNILVVEDETTMANSLKKGLEKFGYNVDIINNGLTARITDIQPYDLIILDWMLPGVDGINLLNFWRGNKNYIPVLMLTAKEDISDTVTGLDAGADDYLSKYFEWDELIARVKALIRRTKSETLDRLESIYFDRQNHKFFENNLTIRLTKLEYEILEHFFNHPHKIFSTTSLIRSVYDRNSNPFSNVIAKHIKSIRSKFQYDPLETIRNFGYRLRLK
jgi:DNA-binding response OmpR family regulator